MGAKITPPTKDELVQYCVQESHSQYEAAAHFGVNRSTVQRWFAQYGITVSEAERARKRAQTCLTKYGVINPQQNAEIQSKTKATCIERYGVDNPSKNLNVQAKIIDTLSQKYGSPLARANEVFRARHAQRTAGQVHLSDEAVAVLGDAQTMHNFIDSHFETKPSMTELARKLGCSDAAVFHAVARFNNRDDFSMFRSAAEGEINDYIRALGINTQLNVKNIIGNHYEIDIYCPDFHVGIEYNGTYWHSDLKKTKNYHFEKTEAAAKAGIRLVHIYEYEWQDPVKQKILKSLLRLLFNKVDQRIYARDCTIQRIDNSVAQTFNAVNHLQGHRNAQVTYGLFYQGVLVQLMSFSRHKTYGWEIIRGCPGSNNLVVGGVSRLFNHFVRNYQPQTVFSYCDYNKFNGASYEKLGMSFIGFTGPDLKYVINGVVYNRNPAKRTEYAAKAECRIWGAGSKKYLWTRQD